MKRFTILAALAVALAPLAMATPAIMKDAKTKNPGNTYACTTCHTALPAKKDNLTAEGKQWLK
jgi:hypothetical protein